MRLKEMAWARPCSCRYLLQRAERIERVGEVTANCSGLVGRKDALAVRLQHALQSSACRRPSIKRPAEMFSRMAASDRDAVVREHPLVKLRHDIELRHQRGRAFAAARAEMAGDLSRQPRAAPRGAADHHRIGTRGGERRYSVFIRTDIAIDD